MLDNRELATLIWIGILIVVGVAVPRFRKGIGPSTRKLIKAAAEPRIVAAFALLAVWSAAWVVVAVTLGYEYPDLIKDAVIIVLTVGFPVLFAAVFADSGAAIVKQIRDQTISLSALLIAYLNLEPFPFPVEMILLPVLTFLYLLSLVAAQNPDAKPVAGCLSVILALAGLAVIVWTVVQLASNVGARDWGALVMEFALAIWLPAVMFPYIYAVVFGAAAETATTWMRKVKKPPVRARVAVASVLGFHLSIRWAREFTYLHEKRVAQSTTFRAAVAAMREFREHVYDRRERQAERDAHIAASAGQIGTDGNGHTIDRREFDATKNALDYLATNQLLRYAVQGDRYWDDLVDTMLASRDRFGLPADHGIHVETAHNGKTWRAWRKMPSTSYLGIGGRDGSPYEFKFAGPERPSGWPGDPGWVDSQDDPDGPPDWDYDDGPLQ